MKPLTSDVLLHCGSRLLAVDQLARDVSQPEVSFEAVNAALIDAANVLVRLKPMSRIAVPWRNETVAWVQLSTGGTRLLVRFGPGQDPRGVWFDGSLLLFYSRALDARQLSSSRPSRVRMAMRNLSEPDREVQLLAPRDASPFAKFVDWEKNWTPFQHGRALFLSYRLEPHIVLSCKWGSGKCAVAHRTQAPDVWAHFNTSVRMGARGSAPAVLLPERDSYVGVAHFRGNTHYTHAFYEFSAVPPFAVLRASRRFQFAGFASAPPTRVQFVAGMYRSGGHFVISYGVADTHSMLTRVPVAQVVRMLSWRDPGHESAHHETQTQSEVVGAVL